MEGVLELFHSDYSLCQFLGLYLSVLPIFLIGQAVLDVVFVAEYLLGLLRPRFDLVAYHSNLPRLGLECLLWQHLSLVQQFVHLASEFVDLVGDGLGLVGKLQTLLDQPLFIEL